jgi:hypothetical protein
VVIYAQENGRFVDRTLEANLDRTNGWWSAVAASDMDGDGDEDLLLGNLGLNSQLKASLREPVELYVKDFDGNGSLDQILTHYRNGVSYPFANVEELIRQIEPLRKKYTSFTDFGARRVQDIFSAAELDGVNVLAAYEFASVYAQNDGGRFVLTRLPKEAQVSPIFAISTGDFDGDGNKDALVAGNFSGVRPSRGKYDASIGLMLRGDGAGHFAAVDPSVSGIVLDGEVRELRPLVLRSGQTVILAARNNDTLSGLVARRGTSSP